MMRPKKKIFVFMSDAWQSRVRCEQVISLAANVSPNATKSSIGGRNGINRRHAVRPDVRGSIARRDWGGFNMKSVP